MIYWLHDTTSNNVHDFICVEQKTAWRMIGKIKKAVSKYLDKIVLLGKVEIDEAWHGAKPSRKLHLTKTMTKFRQKVIVGMKLRKIKDSEGNLIQPSMVILRLIGDNTGAINEETVLPILQKYIHPDSRVVTDGNNIYNNLKNHFRKHDVVEHGIPYRIDGTEYILRLPKFVDYIKYPDGSSTRIHINGIESIWKRWKLKNQQHSAATYAHTQSYLDEFAFHYNIRHLSVLDRFNLLLSLCCQTTAKCEDLRGHLKFNNVLLKNRKGKLVYKNKWFNNKKYIDLVHHKKIDFSRYL